MSRFTLDRPRVTGSEKDVNAHGPEEECLDASETQLVRVLILEDSRSDQLVLEDTLAHVASVRFEITETSRLREAMALLEGSVFDVILTDLGLPDSSGVETLMDLRQVAQGTPIIVLTGLSDERMGIRAMREGAHDYFVKGHYWENGLVRAIREAIERHRVEQALHSSEERFQTRSSRCWTASPFSPRRGEPTGRFPVSRSTIQMLRGLGCGCTPPPYPRLRASRICFPIATNADCSRNWCGSWKAAIP
ncbi:MAG: response regulator [Chthoniobacterales bacterium]